MENTYISRKVREENAKFSRLNVIIIGGGLVGSLCACVFAKRGYKVTLYEKRPDPRKTTACNGRSINLALSHRGRKTLRLVGLELSIMESSIAMKGRMIHPVAGETSSIPYDLVNNQCIYSVGRNFLNQILLNAAEKHEGVTLVFKHKLSDVNFEENTLKLINQETKEIITETADLIIGADGAFSCLRGFMQKRFLYDLTQSYIEHGYMELRVPASRGHKLRNNHLHIWPRGTFMMIALPNQDSSWTVTLFMPFKQFKSITDPEKLLNFFSNTFTDALELIGKEELVQTFFTSNPAPLITVKCGQYHMGDRFLIIGDAAHAMVPFYGQGMNAGFEDCTILNNLLNEHKDNVKASIEAFSEQRRQDVHAVCDLALYNYKEMRDLVTTRSFKFRKTLDGVLSKWLPEIWTPLYNSVSFSHMEYHKCLENKLWQDKVLKRIFQMISTILILVFATIIYVFLSVK
ncbi:kynurenine 3-monooxygenase [Sitophilus oryzae]|uniref:Kynurenine 3-monooxygenase n=1 Tax=Sitophilus oryzae TaxID=7048 RepID=A0A6J2YBB3_SITOR|nr:kynurenine 3-monooxygenase [Sitophilus oryzae]